MGANNIRGIDYRTLHPGTIDFIPKGEIRTRWAEDYASMRENFIYGDALSFDELGKQAVFRKQLFISTLFGDGSTVDHQDTVTMPDGG